MTTKILCNEQFFSHLRIFKDDEDEAIDDERESGDGQEELESESGAKKKVDHDEDRSNPQYIPKKGTFYEHDDRTAEDLDAEEEEVPENANNSTEGLSGSTKVLSTQNQKVTPKQVKKVKDTADRWSHDRFNEYEQAPKSRSELVSAYGYDIRNEDCPPRPRRQRRYGRHQLKYSRNWEDENAYKKTQALAKPSRRPLKPEDFPALGSSKAPSSSSTKLHQRSRRRRPQDENDPQSSSINYRSPVRNRDLKPRDERSSRDQRNQRYNNDNSNNNNARHVKGKKNINFNHNIEFKNQNRKNINYDSTQTKNNNVLNQQMQSTSSHQTSSSHQHNSHSSSQGPSSHHQQQQSHHQQNQATQRYNNNEAPLPTLSFTNSKMNNATTNSSSVTPTSSRTILNFDNSSGNYGRTSREKEVNSQHQQMHTQISNQQQQSAMSPNKNIQYTEHQMDQMKLMEKNYQQQQGKATNLNLNQGPPSSHQQINNMQDPTQSMINNSDMSRSKRYSSLRQRSNLNEGPQTQQSQQYHPQYHQQDIDPQHVQNVMPAQQTPAYIPQQQQAPPPQAQPSIMATQPPPPQQQPATNVQAQQQAQAQKYQAAYYAANPASEYAAQQAALMQAAMVEKYQYTQQTPPAQYLPPQQAQQIYMPTQTQPTQQQQILNYVSTIQPQAPAAAYPQYTNYQNYNIQPQPAATVPPPQQAPPPAQTQPQPIYQTQGGLTYYPNTQMQTAHQQRIIQPQRRPNPIPILAPPDHKSKTSSSNVDDDKNSDDKGGAGSAENIDHILDNMFVQRPMTNIISLKDPTPVIQNDNKNEDQINDGMSVSKLIYFLFFTA